jgi:putative transposase
MATYSQCLHHIVFATKHRKPCLNAAHRRDLFAYLHGTIKRHKCHLYRINGVDEHIHLLVALHADLGTGEFVKIIKAASGNWMRNGTQFPEFEHWQEGYGAFTVSWKDKDPVIEYIKNQEDHHRTVPFLEEYRGMIERAGLAWNEEYLP